ncbi:hypothetical protein [Flavobacterium sp. UBA6135]|uniref:hypothetical protein n=1 Tax=Flavobacterium sp. UBA6135 TaxID=1946553 RepID=UPI0025C5F356|nr:hypothetical protein [Flavobacterium sp. UBA6135]
MKTKYLIIIAFSLLLHGCSSESISDLIDVPTVDIITYEANVKVIINPNCLNCHGATPSNGAPMSLTTYENVRDAVLNRGLLDRISRVEGAPGAMPLGGPRLPQNQINIIEKWNIDGLLE